MTLGRGGPYTCCPMKPLAREQLLVSVLALLATAAALLLGVRLGPATVSASPDPDVLLLNGLESVTDVARFAYQSYNVDFSLLEGESTQGQASCLTQFLRGYDPIKEPIGFECAYEFGGYVTSDWSNYRRFKIDVFNREARPIRLTVRLASGKEGVSTEFQLDSRRWMTLELLLETLAPKGLNLKQVTSVVFLEPGNSVEATNEVLFDNMRLEGRINPQVTPALRDLASVGPPPPRQEGKQVTPELRVLAEVQEQNRGRLPVAAQADVVVVGGGLAGVSAAIAAARAGASVILIERYGYLGGTATAAMVAHFGPYVSGGKQVVYGVFYEMVRRLQARGACPDGRQFDPEQLKIVLSDMVSEAGVKMLLHSFAMGAVVEKGKIAGVIVATKSSAFVVRGRVVIDCTGDGDIAAAAGAAYEKGQGVDDYAQSGTLMFFMGNVNVDKAMAYRQSQDRVRWSSASGYVDPLVTRAIAAGDLPKDIGITYLYPQPSVQPRTVMLNLINVLHVDATDVRSLTNAEVEGRRRVDIVSRFLKKYYPGFEYSYLERVGDVLGVRETRRIVGEYTMTAKDVLSGRRFPDGIGSGCAPIDLHSSDGRHGVASLRLKPGDFYDIPYRCLVPKKVDNLLVAGRCVSATHAAMGSVRWMPTASVTGQAAGAAAALAVRQDVTPRELDVQLLRKTLAQQGAYIEGVK